MRMIENPQYFLSEDEELLNRDSGRQPGFTAVSSIHTVNDDTEKVLERSLLGGHSAGGGEVSVQNDVPDEMGLRLPCTGRSDTRVLLVILNITTLNSQPMLRGMLVELTFKIGAKVTRFELCSKGVCLNVGARRVFQSSFYTVSP
jgi:hypothetical protein